MIKYLTFIVLFCIHSTAFAEILIPLPYDKPENISWPNKEKEYYSDIWNTNAITNVSEPSMIMYKPTKEKNNGTSVILAPGGGIYALSIESEGRNIAKWLNEKGITVFILKYRLVPTGEDGIQDLINIVRV